MPKIYVKRGTKSQIDTAASSGSLNTGEPYLITDQNRIAVGTSATTYSQAVMTGDIGSTVQAYDADLTSWAAIATSAKQDTLVSGTNIKTVNGSSLLGAGDLTISGGGGVEFPVNSFIILTSRDELVTIGSQVWQRVWNGKQVSYSSTYHDLTKIAPQYYDYWTGISGPFSGSAATDVTATNSGFAAVYNNSLSTSNFSTSSDGITWSTPTNTGVTSTTKVFYANGRYFAFSNSGSAASYSTDGTTWTVTASGQPSSLYDLIWTGTRYLACNNTNAYYSTNGTTWTTVSGAAGFNIVKVGSTYVMIYNAGVARTSSDGTSWTNQSIAGTTEHFSCLASDGTTAVTVGRNGSVYSTTDGVTWTYKTSLSYESLSNSARRLICTGTNTFYWFALIGIYKTTDSGETWVPVGRSVYNSSINPFAYYNGIFISGTNAGVVNPSSTSTGFMYSNGFSGTPLYINPNIIIITASNFLSNYYMRTK